LDDRDKCGSSGKNSLTDALSWLSRQAGKLDGNQAAGHNPGLSPFVLVLGHWGLNTESCTPKESFMLKIKDRNNKNECTVFKFVEITTRRGLK
jgi:hypothetical protein